MKLDNTVLCIGEQYQVSPCQRSVPGEGHTQDRCGVNGQPQVGRFKVDMLASRVGSQILVWQWQTPSSRTKGGCDSPIGTSWVLTQVRAQAILVHLGCGTQPYWACKNTSHTSYQQANSARDMFIVNSSRYMCLGCIPVANAFLIQYILHALVRTHYVDRTYKHEKS